MAKDQPWKAKGMKKDEWLAEEVAKAVGAGKPWACDTVDFSDPDRPPTCIEVDFPIIPINEIAAIEGNAGKPIYQMSKWWARRRSSVFRAEVKPQIMPFYACDCPRGHKGEWTRISTGEVMGNVFDPLALTPEERKDYSYHGPEIIYAFWAKHGPCQVTGCGHRTPIMSSPVMAIKTLTVKAWPRTCQHCGGDYDLEERDARMAPGVALVVAETEQRHQRQRDTRQPELPPAPGTRRTPDRAQDPRGRYPDPQRRRGRRESLSDLGGEEPEHGQTARIVR